MSLNKVMLIGRLGKDPEIRYINDNIAVANFPIATSETYKDSNGNRNEKTEWHNIVLWRGLADVAGKYLKKGSQVYIEGKIQTRSYETQSGEKRYTTDIVGNEMRMLDPKDSSPNQNTGSSYQTTSTGNKPSSGVSEPNANAGFDDDLPF
ncbi:MAG: single-stranded DNA-binding protein [Bacteroidia bacterium]